MDYLPIGSVVDLAERSEVKLMIVGYFPQNAAGDQRDYAAVRYPMGVYDNRMFFFFNHSDICTLYHKGFEDNEYYSLLAIINNGGKPSTTKTDNESR